MQRSHQIQRFDVQPGHQNLSMTGKMLRPHLLQSMVGLINCCQHEEKKKFFHEEDKTVLCDFCLLAPEHKDQQVFPLETAADKSKDKLQETLTVLKKKEEEFKMALDEVRRRETHCKEAASTLKRSVISEYGKMHRFLWDEEYQYLQEMDQESKDNLVKLEKGKAKLSQQIQNLQGRIVEIEENLDKEGGAATSRTRACLPSVAHLVHHRLERSALEFPQRDITLDPESANPHLILSEDLRRVQYGSVPQDLPDNKEKFDIALVVLGAQTFTSGKHYWEVEVEHKTVWELGICKDSISRKGKFSSSSEDVMTLTGFTSRNCFCLWNSQKGFHFSYPIQKVGIFLDYEKKHIAFCDVTDRSLIHSFSNIAFEGPLCLYFSPCHPNEESTPGSLIICQKSNQ
uniref:Probable E3 ubiquitin-protein ligase TRIML1 n=1 Tax=Phascolarctos cinereus TaxID=38626 RepID=A0A6P5J3F4_PHACI|nr:probable E3 ubiquitin-protein ligase TRIML1 [Phascolarctos cinereus]